ncbi:MAG: glucose-6-phosphate isomerase, partial [Clostridia bacterium]|nr:glucose-6-phosphate isomerase [Clostridia bacterium]
MALKLIETYTKPFISDTEVDKISHLAKAAHELVLSKEGAGNAFLGWVDLPVGYDKEEFARIKVAAEKIRKSCDVFVVIGIGGSYLGARAAIEFCTSP